MGNFIRDVMFATMAMLVMVIVACSPSPSEPNIPKPKYTPQELEQIHREYFELNEDLYELEEQQRELQDLLRLHQRGKLWFA